jgi:hypothetical protein
MNGRVTTLFLCCSVWALSADCLAQLAAPAIPESMKDGWPTASPESAGISSKPLQDMETAVRAGEFKKIGSVLIARHGKLVYEGYFDGDVNSLRDTRSATKSITGALIGIAIDEKKLSGVDARVLQLLPEHARKNAESRSTEGQDHRRRLSYHEFAARMRRLERRFARQRRAYVPGGRLGAVHSRPAYPRANARGRTNRSSALREIFQLLHRRCVHVE